MPVNPPPNPGRFYQKGKDSGILNHLGYLLGKGFEKLGASNILYQKGPQMVSHFMGYDFSSLDAKFRYYVNEQASRFDDHSDITECANSKSMIQ